MDTLNVTDEKELKKRLHAEGGDGECTMCKFVLIFAFVVLLLVLVFTFVFRLKPEPALVPLSPEESPQVSPEEWDQKVLELGRAFHPELQSSATTTVPVGQPEPSPKAPSSNPRPPGVPSYAQ